MNIGEQIKSLRKYYGLTQKDLGKLSYTSESTIKQYESGKRQPRLEQLQKIASVFGGTIEDIFEFDQPNLCCDPNKITTKANTLYINTKMDKSHPYNTLIEKLENGERLSTEESLYINNYFKNALISSVSSLGHVIENFKKSYEKLNEKGKEKANEQLERTVEHIEMLSKIPEYRKEDSPDQDQE